MTNVWRMQFRAVVTCQNLLIGKGQTSERLTSCWIVDDLPLSPIVLTSRCQLTS